MTKYHMIEPIRKIIDATVRKHFHAGHWPEVEYGGTPGQSESFLMMEYIDVFRLYQEAANSWLKKNADPVLGLWTRKHGASMLQHLETFLSIPPKTSADVANGSVVRLSALRILSDQFRELTVDLCHTPELRMIMEGISKGENGYFEEHGSFYHHELRMIQVDGYWHPLELSAEEREFENRTEGVVNPG